VTVYCREIALVRIGSDGQTLVTDQVDTGAFRNRTKCVGSKGETDHALDKEIILIVYGVVSP
jgi:hypothetical protein